MTITNTDQKNNTLYLGDTVSKEFGRHTIKFGGQFHTDQVNEHPNATFNGTFNFHGTETGSDFADFLLGFPSNFTQSTGQGFYLRNKYGAAFAEDSWRARSNLTLNFGVRWAVASDPVPITTAKHNTVKSLVIPVSRSNPMRSVVFSGQYSFEFESHADRDEGQVPTRTGDKEIARADKERRTGGGSEDQSSSKIEVRSSMAGAAQSSPVVEIDVGGRDVGNSAPKSQHRTRRPI